MKFDKEVLVKHHFWLLLAATFLILIVPIFWLSTYVGADINKEFGDIQTTLNGLKQERSGAVKTPADIETKKFDADRVEESKDQVWQREYKDQEVLFLWPKAFEERYQFRTGLFALDIKVNKVAAFKELPKEAPKETGKEPPAESKGEAKGADPMAEAKIEAKEAPAKTAKETPQSPDGAPKQDETPKEAPNLARGTIVDNNDEYLILKSAGLEDRKFHIIPGLKVGGDDKRVKFGDLVSGDEVEIKYYQARYFFDDFTYNERRWFAGPGVYTSQIEGIIEQVEPINERGEGVVQLRDFNFKKGVLPPNGRFIRYVDAKWNELSDSFAADAWIAQEDMMIQREMFRLVRQANNLVSQFTGSGGNKRDTEYVFENPNFKFELKLSQAGAFSGKITNLLQRRQRIDGVRFRVQFREDGWEEIMLKGAALEPSERGRPLELARALPSSAKRNGIFGVEQVLNWETAAVKRIDQISIGPAGLSHRTAGEVLRPYVQAAAVDPTAAGQPVPGAPADGGLALIRNRYVASTKSDEARRVPVAISIIVEQDHIDRVLTSFENSKLRFITKQWWMNHYPFSMKPQLGTLKGASVGLPAAPVFEQIQIPMDPVAQGNPQNTPADAGQPINPDLPPPPEENPIFTPPTVLPSGVFDELESNVELIIWGEITIYERTPKKPA